VNISGELSDSIAYRLNLTDRRFKATFTLKLWDISIPIPIEILNPFHVKTKPKLRSKRDE